MPSFVLFLFGHLHGSYNLVLYRGVAAQKVTQFQQQLVVPHLAVTIAALPVPEEGVHSIRAAFVDPHGQRLAASAVRGQPRDLHLLDDVRRLSDQPEKRHDDLLHEEGDALDSRHVQAALAVLADDVPVASSGLFAAQAIQPDDSVGQRRGDHRPIQVGHVPGDVLQRHEIAVRVIDHERSDWQVL